MPVPPEAGGGGKPNLVWRQVQIWKDVVLLDGLRADRAGVLKSERHGPFVQSALRIQGFNCIFGTFATFWAADASPAGRRSRVRTPIVSGDKSNSVKRFDLATAFLG